MNNTPSPREVSIAFHQMMARHTDLSRVCLAFISPEEAMSNIMSSFIVDNPKLLSYSSKEQLTAIQEYVDTIDLHLNWVGYLSKAVGDYVEKRKAAISSMGKEKKEEHIDYNEYLEDHTPTPLYQGD